MLIALVMVAAIAVPLAAFGALVTAVEHASDSPRRLVRGAAYAGMALVILIGAGMSVVFGSGGFA